jgi:hypothetical protein
LGRRLGKYSCFVNTRLTSTARYLDRRRPTNIPMLHTGSMIHVGCDCGPRVGVFSAGQICISGHSWQESPNSVSCSVAHEYCSSGSSVVVSDFCCCTAQPVYVSDGCFRIARQALGCRPLLAQHGSALWRCVGRGNDLPCTLI